MVVENRTCFDVKRGGGGRGGGKMHEWRLPQGPGVFGWSFHRPDCWQYRSTRTLSLAGHLYTTQLPTAMGLDLGVAFTRTHPSGGTGWHSGQKRNHKGFWKSVFKLISARLGFTKLYWRIFYFAEIGILRKYMNFCTLKTKYNSRTCKMNPLYATWTMKTTGKNQIFFIRFSSLQLWTTSIGQSDFQWMIE